MLFLDMICVLWRHAGKNGHIIVRGTDNVLLCECVLVPPSQPPHTATSAVSNSIDSEETGVCCYYHTQPYRGRRLTTATSHDGDQQQDTEPSPSFALSVGVDVKKHPTVTVLYKERFSEHERRVGVIDVCYNKLLFKRGFFADSVMKAQGYGVLLLCHSVPDHHSGRAHPTPIRQLVNWRQCQLHIRQHVRTLALETAPATTTISEMAASDERVQPNASAPAAVCTDRQWETSLYRSLKASVSSTFNLLV